MSDLVEPRTVDIVYETENPVLYEVVESVAWITMDRPDFNNAQNGQMTYALDDAFMTAELFLVAANALEARGSGSIRDLLRVTARG